MICSTQIDSTAGYFPRPGIVLDDPEYKPGAHRRPPPIITAAPTKSNNRGDTFDVTVSAIQGPGGAENSSKTGHPYVYPGTIAVKLYEERKKHNVKMNLKEERQKNVSIIKCYAF